MESLTGESQTSNYPLLPFHTYFVEVLNESSSLTFVPRPTASMKMDILSLIA